MLLILQLGFASKHYESFPGVLQGTNMKIQDPKLKHCTGNKMFVLHAVVDQFERKQTKNNTTKQQPLRIPPPRLWYKQTLILIVSLGLD